MKPTRRRQLLSIACAAVLAATLGDLAHSQIEDFLVFDCATFGGNCTREIQDFQPKSFNPPLSIPLEVPEKACEKAVAVGARLEIEHTWVGDLQVKLTHESSNRTVILMDRPGVPALGRYGCPGQDVDVRIHDDLSSDGGSDYTCDITIPAITGDKTSSLFGRRLVIEPDSPPSINGCSFERFDGELLIGNSTVVDGACPPFTKPGDAQCEFRGRYNEQCGGEVTVRMNRDGGEMTLLIVEEAPRRFQAKVAGPTHAELTLFEVIASAEASGNADLEDTGLSAFAGEPCGGTWTLQVADRASPNYGRVLDWSLLLLPAATATPTVTNTASSTPTFTLTSTLPPTATPATPATPPATPTQPDPTATPTSNGGGDTPTPTIPVGTPTEPVDTPTPGGCVGDCNGDGTVSINELIRGVRIALEQDPVESCPSFDRDMDGAVEISELIAAVNNALNGCP